MNHLVIARNGEVLTTSLIIAEGIANKHEAVIKLVRRYLDDLKEFGRVGFEIRPFETNGGQQEREIALLNEQQATLLLTYMRNTDIVRDFKKRLVKAFFELARRSQAPAIPQSLPEALRLAAELEEQRQQLAHQVETLKPKAEAFQRIASTDGSFNITNAAKNLQMNPQDLFAWLSKQSWIYRRAGTKNWLAYQAKIDQDWLEHKTSEYTDSHTGQECLGYQVRITAKGLAKLAELMGKTT